MLPQTLDQHSLQWTPLQTVSSTTTDTEELWYDEWPQPKH